MNNTIPFASTAGWIFGLLLVVIGVMNLFLVHPVPGMVYLLLSLIYFPPVTAWLKEKYRVRIPVFVKILLGVFIMMFTLGVSDLADMYHI
ncbi:MAG TPA: hypothetical protein VLA58_01685 [Chitinophagaceae bacterium]|nr:hypothetical protein [Chitinophagaceae bacterium]